MQNKEIFYLIVFKKWQTWEEQGINEYDLTLFVRDEDGRYRKFEETHFQRAYEVEDVKRAIQEAGMELVGMYDNWTRSEPGKESERICFVAREIKKSV